MTTQDSPNRVAKTARLAVALFFFTNGVLYASLIPHYPGIKADLGLDNTFYGLAIAAYPAGAITWGLLGGFLVRKLSSARVALIFTIASALCLALVGFSGSVLWLVGLLVLLGGSDAIADVGENVHALRVQRAYGRSINNSFHAIWSVGAVAGSSVAALSIALNIGRTTHLILVGILAIAIAFIAYRRRLPGPDAESVEVVPDDLGAAARPRAIKPKTVFILGALALLCVAGVLVEDAGSSWAAIYLGENLGAPAGLAITGYIALVGCQFLGRLLGDPPVDRLGQRAVAYAGGILILGGMTYALAVSSIWATIVGFGMAGFGSATLIPGAYQAVDELPGLKPGTGLTVIAWLLRLGFLLSPPIVGWVADQTSLRLGLLVLPLAGLIVLLTAGVLDTRTRAQLAQSSGRSHQL